jgi:hypothetical protein
MDGVQQFVGEFASDYGPNLDYFLGRPQRSSRGISESCKESRYSSRRPFDHFGSAENEMAIA